MVRSNYTYGFTAKRYLFIEDIGGFSSKSVTNDIENVLLDIDSREDIDLTMHPIVYKDSDGVWDGIACKKEHGDYRVIFIPIRAETKYDAIVRLDMWRKNIGETNLF